MTRIAHVALFAITLTLLAACAEEDPIVEAAAPPPPQYPTAQSVLDEYNRRIMQADVGGYRQTFDLVYAESRPQQDMVDFARAMLAVAELDHLLQERFPSAGEPTISWQPPEKGAAITSIADRRATAEVRLRGNQIELHLVEIEGCWWVSGYTFEHDAQLSQMYENLGLEQRTMFIGQGKAAERVAAKVRSGAITSREQAERAFKAGG